jgi:hypothetical protein
VQRAFRYRFHPTSVQEQLLNRTFGCIRVVWNKTLDARRHVYAAEGRLVGYVETDRNLTAMKPPAWSGVPYLEVSSVPLRQALRHQHAALSLAARPDLGADACGADIRHGGQPPVRSAVKQELPAARPRIPAL